MMAYFQTFSLVPNAPCGVERKMTYPTQTDQSVFLMHRVELKGNFARFRRGYQTGFLMHRVELKGRFRAYKETLYKVSFLMHRVELKGKLGQSNSRLKNLFLMHRVELKVDNFHIATGGQG